MCFDELEPGRPWTALWSGYIRCMCGGIRTFATCTRCGAPLDTEPRRIVDGGGREHVFAQVFAGAEDRFEDYVLVAMIEREWKRVDEHSWLDSIAPQHRPSVRANVVLLFWTYLETRIHRLLRVALEGIPPAIVKDLLRRHWSINARMNQAYGVVFDRRTYRQDLEELGFHDVWSLLEEVQQARNDFVHGEPERVTDALVEKVIANLKREHEAWIAVFNLRAPRMDRPR